MADSKLTRLERNWIKYDVGNSAFVLLNTSVVPIYFQSLLTSDIVDKSMALWGVAQTIASLAIALLMPILGTQADRKGYKIKYFLGFFFTGLVGCFALALPLAWLPFLVVFVLASIGLSSSMTFYDAMLTDVTTDERMDNVSSQGFAWGYIGSVVPFIVCLALILLGPKTGLVDTALATRLSFVITGLWWLAFTIPLVRTYRQTHWREDSEVGIAATFRELGRTAKEIASNRQVLIFILAFFFYIDGVHTVISMATSYGAQVGIEGTQLVLALLVTQFVAFPSAILYGKLAGRVGTLRMIRIAVAAYVVIVIFAAFFLKSAVEFWILAIAVGLFQGGVQALSRSYFGKIIPKEKSNEYYGFFDIFGKYASVMGTALVSGVALATGNESLGVLSIGILLVVGLVLLMMLPNDRVVADPRAQ